MPPADAKSGTADGGVVMTDSGSSSSTRADETGDDDTSRLVSAGGLGAWGPHHDEVLSRAAAEATYEEEAQDLTEGPTVTMARAYQLEMCEESMRRNIIAVVCTF